MCELWVTSGCVERPAPAYITLYTLWLSSDFYDMISECANHGPAGRHAGAPQLARVTPPAPPRSLHGSLLSSISVPLAPVAQPQLASTDPVPRVRSSPRISVIRQARVHDTAGFSGSERGRAPGSLHSSARHSARLVSRVPRVYTVTRGPLHLHVRSFRPFTLWL